MADAESLIRNVSDTARWVAAYRAIETERPDALFHDPFARRLMGERGPAIAKEMHKLIGTTWPFVSRTVVFDELIEKEVANGCDLVVNLAAGLDARPYRMALPRSLMWVEIDLPGILDEKAAILRDDKPVCKLERIRLDLANVADRRKVFADLGTLGRRVLVLSEGLTIYLGEEEVGVLARDLANVPTFGHWVMRAHPSGLRRRTGPRSSRIMDGARPKCIRW
jgi:methyltransferase (TIGR00027 family)